MCKTKGFEIGVGSREKDLWSGYYRLIFRKGAPTAVYRVPRKLNSRVERCLNKERRTKGNS